MIPPSAIGAKKRATSATSATATLSVRRLNVMRLGYLFMGVGLVLVKWPLFFQDGGLASLPVFEGVVAALLTAMSLLAFLGLRYPIQLLPVLIFESLWKLIWLAAVGVPHLLAGDMDDQMSSVFFSVSLVVLILVVTPWRYAFAHYVMKPGDPWRSGHTQPAADQ
jgi:hypothetical protein